MNAMHEYRVGSPRGCRRSGLVDTDFQMLQANQNMLGKYPDTTLFVRMSREAGIISSPPPLYTSGQTDW